MSYAGLAHWCFMHRKRSDGHGKQASKKWNATFFVKHAAVILILHKRHKKAANPPQLSTTALGYAAKVVRRIPSAALSHNIDSAISYVSARKLFSILLN
ncbi:hypothetical protein [Paucimonas lemoignei]|uniref:hypothetical protein n=1 Tax=Paucimonas lemoignei TaxID=29443 RepID=UPI00140430A0|nr:hypothetical protein [Paucimonas lemoignei]